MKFYFETPNPNPVDVLKWASIDLKAAIVMPEVNSDTGWKIVSLHHTPEYARQCQRDVCRPDGGTTAKILILATGEIEPI